MSAEMQAFYDGELMDQLREVIRKDDEENSPSIDNTGECMERREQLQKAFLLRKAGTENICFSVNGCTSEHAYAMAAVAHRNFVLNLVSYATYNDVRVDLLRDTCRVHQQKFSTLDEAVQAFIGLHLFLKCKLSCS